MKHLSALIVDDEFAARDNLKSLLPLCSTSIQVVGTAKCVLEAVDKIKELKPDVVFLDVEMPKHAGYEIVNFIDEINFHIIFVTAYDKYAVKAFQLNAIDYLLKPVDRDLLEEALQKLKIKVKEKQAIENYQSLLKTMEEQENKTIVLNEINRRSIVELNRIIAIKANGAYSCIYLDSNETRTISKNIGYFTELLEEEPQFFRCHKSWLINTEKIKSYSMSPLSTNLEDNIHVRVSRYRKSEFKKILLEKFGDQAF